MDYFERNGHIEQFYKEEEKEIEKNMKKLEDLNTKLVSLNKENYQDIDDLQTCLKEYNIKNFNLKKRKEKMISTLEETDTNEKEIQTKLNELKNILEQQEYDKFVHETNVKKNKKKIKISLKIQKLEIENEDFCKKINDFHKEREYFFKTIL